MSLVLVVITGESEREFAEQVATSLGHANPLIVVGTPFEAAEKLKLTGEVPLYVVLDIDDRGFDVLPELDILAEQCSENTRVVVTGNINDVTFYRELRQRGIIEYFTRPVKISDLRRALVYDTLDSSGKSSGKSEIISFFSAASGDGASTLALNTAYCLAQYHRKSVVVIDMDFQFGMIARNLDLTTPFGIKELFEHPDRSIDSTLVDRMLVDYIENLQIISVPADLRYYPNIKPEMIRDLLTILRQRFDYVIIDLPHYWSQWSSTALADSNRIFMVAQLWLRSLTHATRLLSAWKAVGIDEAKVSLLINRSGAKFTEAVSDKDFERATGKKIDFFLANDIKTVVAAENQGKAIAETGVSTLERQLKEIANTIGGSPVRTSRSNESPAINQSERRSGILSFLKKR